MQDAEDVKQEARSLRGKRLDERCILGIDGSERQINTRNSSKVKTSKSGIFMWYKVIQRSSK